MFEEKVGNLEKGLVALMGNLQINSSAAVTGTDGKGYTAAKTATGAYTITLSDAYVSLLSVNVTLMAATAVDLQPQVVSYDVVSAKTIVVKLLAYDAEGVVSATDPAAACELHFCVWLKNSSV